VRRFRKAAHRAAATTSLPRAHSVRPYNRLLDIAPKERQELFLLSVSVVKSVRPTHTQMHKKRGRAKMGGSAPLHLVESFD